MAWSASGIILSLFILVLGIWFMSWKIVAFGGALLFLGIAGLLICIGLGMKGEGPPASPAAAPASSPAHAADIAARLDALELLRQDGHISQAEWKGRRKAILDEV